MISRAERRCRKKKAIEALVFAYGTLQKLDETLCFNKRLMNSASDIKFRLTILWEKLEGRKKYASRKDAK